jgi:hypothetical protein
MLPQLPEELLDQILYHVATARGSIQYDDWDEPENSWIPHQFRSTFLNTCLASKTLYRLALPHLYKAFSNSAETNRVVELDMPELALRATPPLHDISARYLRTLCAKPDYGKLLRSLSFSVKNHPAAVNPQFASYKELADLALFSQIAPNFWFGAPWTAIFQSNLPTGLIRKMPDAIMCLVLLMCPNIETLEIMGGSEEMYDKNQLLGTLFSFLLVVGTMEVVGSVALDKMLQRTVILQRVQSLTLVTCPLRLTWAEATAVFSLPALRKLRMGYLCKIYDDHPRVSHRWPQSTELKSLELDNLSVPGILVAELLKWCPNLTKLDANWGHFNPLRADYDRAYHKVGKAISEYTPLLVSLKLMDSCPVDGDEGSRLRFTLRELQHLTYVELGCDSVWCHPSDHVDAINDNLPDSIESLFVWEEGQLPDNLPTEDSTPEYDFHFDAPCVADNFSDDDEDDICQCRTRDIRRLLLDKRFTRLRRVIFSEKSTSAAQYGEDTFHVHDRHVLRHIWTPAVRRHGWKLLERIPDPTTSRTPDPTMSHTEAVLYREVTDGVEDVATMSGC